MHSVLLLYCLSKAAVLFGVRLQVTMQTIQRMQQGACAQTLAVARPMACSPHVGRSRM